MVGLAGGQGMSQVYETTKRDLPPCCAGLELLVWGGRGCCGCLEGPQLDARGNPLPHAGSPALPTPTFTHDSLPHSPESLAP